MLTISMRVLKLVFLCCNLAYLLLKILEEMVESDLHRTFNNHIGSGCNFPVHGGIGIEIEVGVRAIFYQIYCADGFNRTH